MRKILSSPRFFKCIVVLLVVQAAWIALSGRYPMAFDEDFHLGIIRLYAHHLSPFLSSQPAGADHFGAVARDPSYLYQYLMSFPYRLITVFTHSQTAIVLILRAINIALFASSLPLWRRLLSRLGAPRALINGSLLVYVLIPVAPLLAAQINYDNLLIPLVALTLLLVERWNVGLRRQQPLNLRQTATIISVCLLTSLVKYAFLPMFVAIGLFMLVRYRQVQGGWNWRPIARGFTRLSRRTAALLALGLIVSGGLFIQREGVNLVRYHAPVPNCDQVLSVQQCSAYGPWIRDYNYRLNKVSTGHSPVVYAADWLHGMWLRLFFAVDGPATNFQTRGPLLVPGLGVVVLAVAGVVALAWRGRLLLQRYNTSLLLLIGGVVLAYLAALWLDNYRAWLHTGQPVAVNGRYLLPVLPLLLIALALAIHDIVGRRPRLQTAISSLVILVMIWGGGVLTYILRSNDAWYWNSSVVRSANHAVQHVIGPITPGYHHPTEFL